MNVSNSHMQAITTKYLGPTNTKGRRIKASCEAGSITVYYDYEFSVSENHDSACKALLAKLEWNGTYIGGGYANGYIYVCNN